MSREVIQHTPAIRTNGFAHARRRSPSSSDAIEVLLLDLVRIEKGDQTETEPRDLFGRDGSGYADAVAAIEDIIGWSSLQPLRRQRSPRYRPTPI
jgi:hypothetical protein